MLRPKFLDIKSVTLVNSEDDVAKIQYEIPKNDLKKNMSFIKKQIHLLSHIECI